MTDGPYYFSTRPPRENARRSVATLLLVEGSADLALAGALAKKLKKTEVQIFDMNGKDNDWAGTLKFALSGQEGLAIRSVGLIVDADTSTEVAFNYASEILIGAGLAAPPDSSSQAKATSPTAPHEISSSIFVTSATGNSSGNLDDLVLEYFDSNVDNSCIDNYAKCVLSRDHFNLDTKSKNQIHLATRKKSLPSIEMGIRRGVIDVDHSTFLTLKNWLDMTIAKATI